VFKKNFKKDVLTRLSNKGLAVFQEGTEVGSNYRNLVDESIVEKNCS
jgi:hypothetical protein